MPPFARTFSGYRPLKRPDGVHWATVKIRERATSTGFSDVDLIDTQPVTAYADAANPPLMSFGTGLAQLDPAWYQLVFVDTNGAEGPTTPEAAGNAGVFLPPSAAEVRQRSAFLQSLLPTGVGSNDETLREEVLDAKALVESLTCRNLDVSLGDPRLDRLALRAVTLKTEAIANGEALAKARKARLGTQLLKSFSAGPYSETYFGPDQAAALKRLDPDPATHEVLWALATQECRDAWLVLWGISVAPPFAGVQAFDYGHRGGQIPSSFPQVPRRRW